jgi:hypothetical protein
MAKAKLNSAFVQLSGQLDGLVFKQYATGVVVSRLPRMEHIQPSPAQLAQRERFRAAGKFHQQVLADPVLKRRYMAAAKKQAVPLSAVTLAAYMRQTAKA